MFAAFMVLAMGQGQTKLKVAPSLPTCYWTNYLYPQPNHMGPFEKIVLCPFIPLITPTKREDCRLARYKNTILSKILSIGSKVLKLTIKNKT